MRVIGWMVVLTLATTIGVIDGGLLGGLFVAVVVLVMAWDLTGELWR